MRGPFDAIFCRNVMIYFDRDTQLAVLRRFAPLLKPDGLLFVGHSETFITRPIFSACAADRGMSGSTRRNPAQRDGAGYRRR